MKRKQFIKNIIGMSILTSFKSFPLDATMGNSSFDSEQTDFATFDEVHLSNTNLQKAINFWTKVVGMKLRHSTTELAEFGTENKTLIVVYQTATKPFAEGFSGLYHFAIHAPNKLEFAKMIQRLININYQFSPIDHTMSKSVYLKDPDSITVEFVLETPERFKRVIAENGLWIEDSDGNIHSASDTLDLNLVLGELENKNVDGIIDKDTKIGHFHFYVSNLEKTNEFYKQLGFIQFNNFPQFMYADVGMESAYKHRIAMNMWHGKNKPYASKEHAGLKHYTIAFQSTEKLNNTIAKFPNAKKDDNGFWLNDPTGNLIYLNAV